jgi:hypothetical protein
MFIANLFNRSQLPINLIASCQVIALVLESQIWRNPGATLARAVSGVFLCGGGGRVAKPR